MPRPRRNGRAASAYPLRLSRNWFLIVNKRLILRLSQKRTGTREHPARGSTFWENWSVIARE